MIASREYMALATCPASDTVEVVRFELITDEPLQLGQVVRLYCTCGADTTAIITDHL